MALQSSGAISLADIQTEFGGSNPISISEYYGMGGVPASGIISFSDFYGTSAGVIYSILSTYCGWDSIASDVTNKVTRINSSGTLVGTQTTVGSLIRHRAGAAAGGYGIYWGGSTKDATKKNTCTRLNNSGTLVSSETSVGTAHTDCGGSNCADVDIALFWSGLNASGYVDNKVTRINPNGTIYGSETTLSDTGDYPMGCPINDNAMFYCRYITGSWTNKVTRVNSSAAQIGLTTTVGTARAYPASAEFTDIALYYGGADELIYAENPYNYCTRIDASGALIGSETTVGSQAYDREGGRVGDYGVFITMGASEIVTRLTSAGALVSTESTLGADTYVQSSSASIV